MSGSHHPTEPPPSYAQATGSSTASGSAGASSSNNNNNHASTTHLNVPGSSSTKNRVPSVYRRSMEDEQRALPPGWMRTYDPQAEHQFFVDTTADPPRSIWTHPYDDQEYLASLTGEERERIEEESMNRGKHQPSKDEILHADSDDEDEGDHRHSATSAGLSSYAELPPRPDGKGKGPQQNKTFGRKLKDKLTGMTHEEREVERRRRAEAERQMYQQHMAMRQAMTRAMQTGQPQLLGKDRDGRDVYIEPPAPPAPYGGYGGGYYGQRGYGYSPWGGPGGPQVYSTPNARYIRPQGPYARGRGPGMGMPLAIGGGLLGGLLLGDMMF